MSASTNEEVFDFEGNLEKSFYEFLKDNGIKLATANDPNRLSDDFVGVQVAISGLAEDEHMSETPGGNLEYDHYNYSVEITVHTDRNENATPRPPLSRYHRELVAKIRSLLSISRAAQGQSLNDKLELYWINRLVPTDTSYEATENNYAETTLTYSGDFSILTGAWPNA